jgi:hypothetical protein
MHPLVTRGSRCAIALLLLVSALPAQALRRSHDGAGQAVLVPYYTVLDDRSTLLSIVNHSEQPKAVRFLLAEGRNGRPALTFNIYLAPRDTWAGAVVSDPAGARLVSSDTTCTVPSIPAAGVALRNFGYTGSVNDGLGAEPARLAEGQFEAIEMGVLTGTAATHVLQRECAALVQRFVTGGVWTTAPNTDVAAPAGQLSVDAQIVDVAAGSVFDVPTVALDEFSGAARHGAPGESTALRFAGPTLAAGQTRFVVEGDSFVPGNRAADAVSLVLMAASLEGPFSVDPGLAATTEWIVALPTRQNYLDDRAGGVLAAGTAPLPPFASASGTGTAPRCNPVTWETIARDGSILGTDDAFFPSPIAGTLCAQVTRVTLTRAFPAVPGTFEPLTTRGEANGRLRLGLRPDVHHLAYFTGPDGAFGASLDGLPALALPLIEARNSNAQPGLLATYGYTGHVVRRQTGSVDF